MDFGSSIKKAIEIIKLNSKAIKEVAADSSLTGPAFLILVIAGVATAIGSLNLLGIITGPISAIIGAFISVAILFVFAKIFGGKGQFMPYFRALTFPYVLTWIAVIPLAGPIISGIASLWLIPVSIVVTRDVHKLSLAKSIIAVLLPLIIVFVIAMILAVVIGAAIFSALGGGAGGFLGSIAGG